MNCFTEITYAMYADGELPADESRQVEQHLLGCARCQALLEALRGENHVLAAALEDISVEAPTVAPRRVWRWPAAVAAGLTVVLVAAIALTPTAARVDWLTLALEVGLFLTLHADTLSRLVGTVAVVTMAALAVCGIAFLTRRPAGPLGGLLALLVTFGAVEPALAFETRRGATVTVASGETIDGTLVAAGETVRIDGTIDGDLITAAREVAIRGTVKGDLIVVGVTVDVEGVVEGNAYTFAGTTRIRGRLARSLYGLNRTTRLDLESRIDCDLHVVGRSVDIDGTVGRSAWIFGSRARVAGLVRRHLTVVGDRLEVAAPARIGGNLSARVRQAQDLSLAPSATIGGRMETRLGPPGRARYAEPRFYFWMATNLFGASILGFAALLLAPSFFHGSVQTVRRAWRSLTLGLIVLVAGPIAMALAAITLVGLPLALSALGLYLLGLYASQIVVAAAIGRALLRSESPSRRDSLLGLVVGLLLLTLGFRLPILGPGIRFAVACVGLGALSVQLARAVRSARAKPT